MRLYIPRSHRAAIMLFRRGSAADYARIDAIHARRADIARQAYDAIMTGNATEAHQRYNGGLNLAILHRSTRYDCLQESHFCMLGGAWTATSHRNIYAPADIDLHPGSYITITA